MRDEPTLDDLAGAIADRRPIDWDAVRVRDIEELALIGKLETISRASSACRPAGAETPAPELRPGTVWGSLRITAKIGEGAFGRVYRAWDHRLERDVALKLIAEAPRSVNAPDTVEEGRLLARVRHPNVATVFGADRIDGQAGIWMELVIGRTLEQELEAKGPLGARDVALIGRDLCRALAAVHDAGLLHRDVKAQNVVREPSGRVVLMDFGTGREPLSQDEAAGGTAGTPLYLAPELFDGGSSSVASDVYAVGVLLYHLATGTYPVSGRSLSEIRAAHRQGSVTTEMPDTIPRPLARVISRALARDPSARFPDAAALADALDSVAGREGRIRRRLAWGALGAVAAAAIVTAVIWAPGPAPTPPVQRFILSLDGDEVRGMALSPDGNRLAYITRGDGVDQLIVRALGRFSGSAIYAASSLAQPFFSPDGEWIGVSDGTSPGRIVKLSTSGGAVTVLSDLAATWGARWHTNGTIIFGSGGSLWTVPEIGGAPVQVRIARLEPGESLGAPDVLPTGAILATDRRRSRPSRLVAVTPDGEVTALEEDASNGKYSPTGHLLFVRDQRIFARAVDRSGVPSGPAVAISEAGYTSDFAISSTGGLVYRTVSRDARPGLGAAWATRDTGTITPVPLPVDDYRPFGWQLSPDGSMVYAALPETRDSRVDDKQSSRIWIGDVASGVLSQLTFEDTIPIAWAPDSRSIAIKTADGSLIRKWVDAAEPDTLLVEPQPFDFGNRGTWSSDGMALKAGRWAVMFPPKDAVGAVRPTVAALDESRVNEFSPVFSPDGRWLAFQSNESGRNEIHVRPYPGPGPAVQISRDGGRLPKWQGDEIFYSRQDSTGQLIEAATVELQPSPRVTSTTVTLRADDFADFDVTSDGHRFLLLVGKAVRPSQLNLTLNWPSELRQLR